MAVSDARTKMIKLLDTLGELDEDYTEKRRAILAEMSSLLRGGESIGDKLKRLRATFTTGWAARYQKPFDYKDGENVDHLKRMLGKQRMTVEDIENRMLMYLGSDDPYYIKVRHSFGVFVRDVNSLVGLPLMAEDNSTAETTAKLKAARGDS